MAVAARIKEKHLPSRVAGKRSPSLVGAIEGTIIATAVVVGLDESDSVTPHRGFWILVATGSFFWIAHVYADLLADRIKGHHRMGRHAIAGCHGPGMAAPPVELRPRRSARARRRRRA